MLQRSLLLYSLFMFRRFPNLIVNLFTMSELCYTLVLCRDGTASLSYPFLHHHPTAMEFLLNFFYWVYTSELFPDLLHQSIVIPIPKPGKDHSLPRNFRPISFTSCLCKLFERVVVERLVWVLEDIQGLSPLQFGFHRFHSMADPLSLLRAL